MPSAALKRWQSVSQTALDEIEAAHAAIGGTGPGRRTATLQVNHAIAMLLSSQFQGFARDLHSEAVDFLRTKITPPSVASVVASLMVQGRRLDSGNPNPGNLGADFSRLGLDLWPAVKARSARNITRQASLEQLNTWRNAIAHQYWSKVGSPNLWLKSVRLWRKTCSLLAVEFDAVVGVHLASLVGSPPW